MYSAVTPVLSACTARTCARSAAWRQLQERAGSAQRRDTATVCAAANPRAAATSSLTPLLCRHGDLAWGSCVSTRPSVSGAVAEAAAAINAAAGDAPFEPTLALVFASCNYGSQLQDVVRSVRRSVPSVRHVFGCSVRCLQHALHTRMAAKLSKLSQRNCETCLYVSTAVLSSSHHHAHACAHLTKAFGVLGGSQSGPLEVEGEPGISLTLAQLPGVELSVMHTLRGGVPTEGGCVGLEHG